jgi:hypothetical protein
VSVALVLAAETAAEAEAAVAEAAVEAEAAAAERARGAIRAGKYSR